MYVVRHLFTFEDLAEAPLPEQVGWWPIVGDLLQVIVANDGNGVDVLQQFIVQINPAAGRWSVLKQIIDKGTQFFNMIKWIVVGEHVLKNIY